MSTTTRWKDDVEHMSLEQVQAELKEEMATPLRSKDDAARRQQLWKRLDHLLTEGKPA